MMPARAGCERIPVILRAAERGILSAIGAEAVDMNLDDLRLTPEDYRPQPPSGRHYRIGLIGCGGIANGAHLPAYRDFGYEVVACSDIDSEAVESTQARWGIEAAGTDPRVVLDNPKVEVIDLAVHPHARLKLWPALLEAGKPILSQKPFAMTWEDAVSMATSAQASGVMLMINQQARWAPAHAAIKLLIDSGICGPLFSVAHVRRGYQDQPDKWWRDVVNFNIVDHGVHFLDLIRHFSGRTPDAVSTTTAMMQGQNAVSPLSHTLALHFDSGDLTAIDHFNNIIQSRAAHSEFWHIDGAEGSITGKPQWVDVTQRDEPERRVRFPIEGSWFPEAFGGSMGEWMAALNEGREPLTSSRDNLNSIRIAAAGVRSNDERRTVRLEEFVA